MILFLNNLPVSESLKLERLVERAKTLYDSNYYDISKTKWLGDNLTVESLFPEWIIKEAQNSSNVLVVSIIKNYMRWLLSLEYGYGAQLDWENIRIPLLSKPVFYEAYLDFYFPGANFNQNNLNDIKKNVKKFAIKADANYFNIKGTPQAIKYLISNLLGIPWNSIRIFTGNSNVLTVQIASNYSTDFNKFIPFLESHVFPAGVSILYQNF